MKRSDDPMKDPNALEEAAATKSSDPSTWQAFPEMDWGDYLTGPDVFYLADDNKTVLGVGGEVIGVLDEDGNWEKKK